MNCYFDLKNTKAYNHFNALGATLKKGVKHYYINGHFDAYYADGGLRATRDVYYVSGLPCCKSGSSFHKYLKNNNLLMK